MADGALGVAGMLFDKLSDGQSLGGGFIVRKLRHPLRRTRQAFAEQHLADPVAAQNRTRARGTGLLPQRRRLGENPAARKLLHAIDATPFGGSVGVVRTVGLGSP